MDVEAEGGGEGNASAAVEMETRRGAGMSVGDRAPGRPANKLGDMAPLREGVRACSLDTGGGPRVELVSRSATVRRDGAGARGDPPDLTVDMPDVDADSEDLCRVVVDLESDVEGSRDVDFASVLVSGEGMTGLLGRGRVRDVALVRDGLRSRGEGESSRGKIGLVLALSVGSGVSSRSESMTHPEGEKTPSLDAPGVARAAGVRLSAETLLCDAADTVDVTVRDDPLVATEAAEIVLLAVETVVCLLGTTG